MKYTLFGKTGLRVSQIALGTGNFGTGWGHGADPDTSKAVFNAYAEAGGNFIDTADIYQFGESEELLGALLQGRRENFVLATKFTNGAVPNANRLVTGNSRKASQAMMFRRWANQVLRQYLLHGFVIDAPRMKDPNRNDRLDDLLEIIEDIRTSEANVWKQILDLVSYCSDYHAMSPKDKSHYFATFQNAMHWAVASATAAEIIDERVDASKEYAGLTRFKGDQPTVADAQVEQNYFGEDEIKRLNMITGLALRFLKSQAEQGRLVTVAQYTEKLREIVKLDGRPLIPLAHRGEITKAAADKKAAGEIAVYKERVRLQKEAAGEKLLADLLGRARELADEKRAKRKEKPKP